MATGEARIVKVPLSVDEWLHHSDADDKLIVLIQHRRPPMGWNSHTPNQPGLYYHPVSQIFYRVQIKDGHRQIYRIALGDLLDLMDNLE